MTPTPDQIIDVKEYIEQNRGKRNWQNILIPAWEEFDRDYPDPDSKACFLISYMHNYIWKDDKLCVFEFDNPHFHCFKHWDEEWTDDERALLNYVTSFFSAEGHEVEYDDGVGSTFIKIVCNVHDPEDWYLFISSDAARAWGRDMTKEIPYKIPRTHVESFVWKHGTHMTWIPYIQGLFHSKAIKEFMSVKYDKETNKVVLSCTVTNLPTSWEVEQEEIDKLPKTLELVLTPKNVL